MAITNGVIIVGIIFVIILLSIVVFIPMTPKTVKRKRKVQAPEASKPDAQAQEVLLRMQRNIQSLHGQITTLEQREKAREHELMLEKIKVNKLQDKLSQERDWHTKEQKTWDKKIQEFHHSKDELSKLHDQFSKEHAENLRQKKDIEEFKSEAARLQDAHREVQADCAQWKAKVENYQKEIMQLRKENSALTKKAQDTMWVAKSDHDKLEQLLREKEKELERIKRGSSQ